MFINSQKIMNLMEELAPKKYAEQWDNVGLLIGNDQVEIDKVMLVLDITEAVINEAIEKNVDLIITHHPFIFKGLKEITDHTYHGRLIRQLIKNDIHVYAAHTNMDIAENGLNDYLASLINLDNIEILEVTSTEAFYKLTTFVPLDAIDLVENALYKAGAGRMGNYDECSYKIEGVGSFRPLDGSKPAIGDKNVRTFVKEFRIEVIVSNRDLDKCTEALKKAHPYETPAYDVIKLENLTTKTGLGRVGTYSRPISGVDLISRLKTVLNCDSIRVAGLLPEKVFKVGLCTGAGSEFIHKAKLKGCDVYITGDLKYHEAQLAEQLKMSIFDCGHYETETIYMTYLLNYLENKCSEKNYEVKIIKSEFFENPFKAY